MLNKRISILTSLLIVGSSISVSANTLTTPTIVNMEATILDVEVPLSMPINVDREGIVTTANNVTISNNSYGPIELSSISITPKNSWTLSDFDKDYSDSVLGLKEFGMEIDNESVDSSGLLNLSNKFINGGETINIGYNASVSPQKESIVDSNIADVVFTVGWGTRLEFNTEMADKWTTGLASIPKSRYGLASVELGGKIYCIGGRSGSNYLNNVEVYDPATNSWETKTSMPTARYNLAASVVDGKIYCIGGYNDGYLTTVEVYDPVTDSWETKTSIPGTATYTRAVAVKGKIYCIDYFGVRVYDPSTDSWGELLSSNPKSKISNFGVVEVGGKIYCIGGYNSSGKGSYVGDVTVYDIATNSWDTKTSMPTARSYFDLVEVGGKIYCISGAYYSNSVGSKSDTNTVHSYDTGWRYN